MRTAEEWGKFIEPGGEIYAVDDDLQHCDVLHMYPGQCAHPDGHEDARHFRLVGYNTRTRGCRVFGSTHDEVRFDGNVDFRYARIFVDGSTMLVFARPVYVVDTQGVLLVDPEDETAS